jgi:formylglycine-generating enzyme required for sulfatase activity
VLDDLAWPILQISIGYLMSDRVVTSIAAVCRGGETLRRVAAMTALILVVASWMHDQPSRVAAPTVSEGLPLPTTTQADAPGFRTNAWFLPDEDILGFVEIPAGPFIMGSDQAMDPQAFDNELWSGTRGTVDLPLFYISRYEVTVAQFNAFVEDTGFRVTDQAALQAPPDHPVGAVSWTDALAYSRWLERTLKDWPQTPPVLSRLLRDGGTVTLPSEAEWEKAARGTDGRIYPWGSQPRRDRANFGGRSPTPVGSFECPECPFGLHDMAGNVWEWTRSPHQLYPYDETDDREDLDVDALWVMRGGSFGDPARNVRTATRGGADPGVRRPFIGFRLVISTGVTRPPT